MDCFDGLRDVLHEADQIGSWVESLDVNSSILSSNVSTYVQPSPTVPVDPLNNLGHVASYSLPLQAPISNTATEMTKLSCSTSNSHHKYLKRGNSAGSTCKFSTDPQSVAARLRRKRISERFKALQKLVPGGTKMDTASMLDEAITYVKFLKHQIWLHELAVANGAPSSSTTPTSDDVVNTDLEYNKSKHSW